MNSRTAFTLSAAVTSVILIGISFTNNYAFWGILIGFFTGLVNIQWLFRDSQKAIEKDLYDALKIYYKSLFSRLGMVTLVVATLGRFRPEWLFYLALGITVGVIIPLILAIRQQLIRGRG